jgi:hypothetical protein
MRATSVKPPPKIRALGIIQDHFTMRWHASGEVEGIGKLEAWGDSLLEAMERLRAKVAEINAIQEQAGNPDAPQASSP